MVAGNLMAKGVAVGRPGVAGLVLDEVGYATRELWRSRIVLIFSFLLPLVWLAVIGIVAGDATIDGADGVRVMQFTTPTAAAMGILFSTFPPLANSLGLAREQRITKRLRGTPLPLWTYLMGRVGAAVILAAAAVVVMVGVGVAAYGVKIQWDTVPATLVTVAAGIGCLAALGLAVGALAPSASTAQAFAIAAAVAVSFLSGMFTAGSPLPEWMETVAWAFPVGQMLMPLQAQFNPFADGSGWNLAALAAMAAWGIGGVTVASWALGREPRLPSAAPRDAGRSGRPGLDLAVTTDGRPPTLDLVLDQTRWATLAARRDAGWVLFAVAMPIGLYVLFGSMYGDLKWTVAGWPFSFFFACSMTAYGAAVTAFVNLPEVLAKSRDLGILKRLRGTPLRPWQYLAGRTTSALWIALITAVGVFATGIAFMGARIAVEGLVLGATVLVLGTLTMASCGYAIAALAPNSRATGVIGLGILLPLAFFSDVFLIGGAPDWIGTIGSIFPLRHFVYGLARALDPAGPSLDWLNVGVMTAWLAGAAVLALARFRWEAKA